MTGLTPNQEEYFRILESLEPSEDLRRSIEAAKDDLRDRSSGSTVHRGYTRVKGFTPNESDRKN